MPKLDLSAITVLRKTGYPPQFAGPIAGRSVLRVGSAGGLTELGASLVTLEPGAWSSQRHWHDGEDEFLIILQGEATLVEDDGAVTLKAGDCAAFPKGSRNGHHLRNESQAVCRFLVVSAGEPAGGGYSDIDMMFTAEGSYVRKDGTPLDARRL